MRGGPRVSLLFGLATALLGALARAEPVNRVAIHAVDECEHYVPEIERRLAATVGDTIPSELSASVSIESSESGYLVTLATRDSEGTRGTTRIAVPTCREAVDATVEVLALALGESDTEDTPAAPRHEEASGYGTVSASGASSKQAGNAPWSPAVQSSAPIDQGVHEGSRETLRSRRASLAAGVDVGTLPDPSLSLSGGFVQSLDAVELGGNDPATWPYTWALVGNGGLVTTVGDLDRWLSAFFGGSIVSAETFELMKDEYLSAGAAEIGGETVYAEAGAGDFGLGGVAIHAPGPNVRVLVTTNTYEVFDIEAFAVGMAVFLLGGEPG